jgi:hypothetical protein
MNLLEVTNKNFKQLKTINCFICHTEILKELEKLIYYTQAEGRRHYFCDNCYTKSQNKGYSNEKINELEEQSNINLLMMYGKDKKIPIRIFRRLHKLKYLDNNGRLTEKALNIMNNEKNK